jgi:hypothetical protein
MQAFANRAHLWNDLAKVRLRRQFFQLPQPLSLRYSAHSLSALLAEWFAIVAQPVKPLRQFA